MISINNEESFAMALSVVELLRSMLLEVETDCVADSGGFSVLAFRAEGASGLHVRNNLADTCVSISTYQEEDDAPFQYRIIYGDGDCFYRDSLCRKDGGGDVSLFSKDKIYRMTEFIRDWLLCKEPRVENYQN
jgi:hypothetical protein